MQQNISSPPFNEGMHRPPAIPMEAPLRRPRRQQIQNTRARVPSLAALVRRIPAAPQDVPVSTGCVEERLLRARGGGRYRGAGEGVRHAVWVAVGFGEVPAFDVGPEFEGGYQCCERGGFFGWGQGWVGAGGEAGFQRWDGGVEGG